MGRDFFALEESLFNSAEELETDISKFVDPTNTAGEEKKFFETLEKGGEYNPRHTYLPKNPIYSHFTLKPEYERIMRELNGIEVDARGVGQLLIKKKDDLIKKMEFIRSIGSERFTEKSVDLFGKPSRKLVRQALRVVKKDVEPVEKSVPAEKMAELLGKELKKKKIEWNVFAAENMSANALVLCSEKEMRLRQGAFFSQKDLKRLNIHEIETHIYRHLNGKLQPFHIFTAGTSRDWLITEEGLAVVNEELFKTSGMEQTKSYAGRAVAVHKALNNSFFGTYSYLEKFFPKEEAYLLALRAKRGLFDSGQKGAFTKDYFYLEGKNRVKKFLRKGGNIKDLYYGKISIEDVQTLGEIPQLVKPKFLPDYSKVFKKRKKTRSKAKIY